MQAVKNSQTRAVLLDLDTLNRSDLVLDSLYSLQLDWEIHDKVSLPDVLDAVKDKDIIVTNKVVIDRELMQQLDKLKLICVAATGTNNVDLEAARELGIEVCNATAYATASVVQYVFSVMLSLHSRLPEYQRAVHAGRWAESEIFCLLDYSFHELAGKTLGIVGYGELGQAVASVARAFGMQVLIARRNAEDKREGRVALHEMLPQVDILSLHCPLTEATNNLIAEKELALLPRHAVLINSARGRIVNEDDLLTSLQQGEIGGAALDVLSTEPPGKNHPLCQLNLPNLIVTPHIAWASVESRQRLLDQVALTISCYLSGNIRNSVL